MNRKPTIEMSPIPQLKHLIYVGSVVGGRVKTKSKRDTHISSPSTPILQDKELNPLSLMAKMTPGRDPEREP